MVFNCSDHSGDVHLPAGNWQVLADGENAFLWQKNNTVAEKVNVPEFSAVILGLK